LTDRELLLVARAILDLPPSRWRMLGKQGYAVVTNRRIFIVHADAAYSGRTRRPRYPHVREFDAVPPQRLPEKSLSVALRRDGLPGSGLRSDTFGPNPCV
jgi:hypothetical protein